MAKKRKLGRPPAPLDMSTPAGRLGARIRAAREAAGKTTDALAAALGVDHSTVWRWERGETDMSVTTLATIAEALGVDITKFLRR